MSSIHNKQNELCCSPEELLYTAQGYIQWVLPEITLNALLRKPDHHYVLMQMQTTVISATEAVKKQLSET